MPVSGVSARQFSAILLPSFYSSYSARMVYVNSQKLACGSCIKGHRSSSCHHTDRPLFEIKKKGRPISQCEKCRELRKNKRMHVKCNCSGIATHADEVCSPSTTSSMPRRLARREPPANPTLPNGLSDLWPKESLSGHEADPRQRVDSLLNPCHCKSVWKCKCSKRGERSINLGIGVDQDNTVVSPSVSQSVKSCCEDATISDRLSPSEDGLVLHTNKTPTSFAAAHREKRHLASMPYSYPFHAGTSPFSLPMSSVRDESEQQDDQVMSLDLPPLNFPNAPEADSWILPSLKNICDPSDQTKTDEAIRSLTSCGCGSACICPGCKEHRGAEFAALSGEDCPDGCGSCVDHMGGLALPSAFSISIPSSTSGPPLIGTHCRSHTHVRHPSAALSTLDHFHAVAALLPPPPSSSRPGTFDPTNVAVYKLSSGSSVQKHDWQKAAGLVQVPPLNCCAGQCKCPGGMCGCGSECGGSCGRHGARAITGALSKGKERGEAEDSPANASKENGGERFVGGCCAGKKPSNGSLTSKKALRL